MNSKSIEQVRDRRLVSLTTEKTTIRTNQETADPVSTADSPRTTRNTINMRRRLRARVSRGWEAERDASRMRRPAWGASSLDSERSDTGGSPGTRLLTGRGPLARVPATIPTS